MWFRCLQSAAVKTQGCPPVSHWATSLSTSWDGGGPWARHGAWRLHGHHPVNVRRAAVSHVPAAQSRHPSDSAACTSPLPELAAHENPRRVFMKMSPGPDDLCAGSLG